MVDMLVNIKIKLIYTRWKIASFYHKCEFFVKKSLRIIN